MFLSKKTATHLNKPKNQDTNKVKKVLGGKILYIQDGRMRKKKCKQSPIKR